MLLPSLLAPLAPSACFGCGGHASLGSPLCPECRAGLTWLGPEPVALDAAGAAVPLWAPLAYRGPAAALARALKFRGAAGLASTMAAQIVANAPGPLLAEGAALVPVPLHPARARRRGFNQAERLAAAIGARAALPVADVLERRGDAATQMGRPRRERLRLLTGSVELRGAAPAVAVLVDDVATTGATLTACAAALTTAGSDVRAAVVYARTPGR